MSEHKSTLFIGLITVVTLIVLGLTIKDIGTPYQARLMAEDKIRIQHLNAIAFQIEEEYRDNKQFPDSVQDLTIDNYYLIDNDDIDLSEFELKVTGSDTYEICTTMQTDSKDWKEIDGDYFSYGISITDSHVEGLNCFKYVLPEYIADKGFPEEVLYVEGIFSSPTADLKEDVAQFNFEYSGNAYEYSIDVSIYQDFSDRIYFNFARGTDTELRVENPRIYDEYTCGVTIYWRLNDGYGNTIPIQSATVMCDENESSTAVTQ